MKVERRDVIVASVGMVLVAGAMGALGAGAVGHDGEDEALVFAANLSLACLGFAFAGWLGYYEKQWRLWKVPRAVVALGLGCAFAIAAFGAPWISGWLFALIAELA